MTLERTSTGTQWAGSGRLFRTRLGLTLLVIVGLASASAAGDRDADGVVDGEDNCIDTPNPSQCDADLDGYGSRCDADLNNDGARSGSDILLFLRGLLGQTYVDDVLSDLNCDGAADSSDIDVLRDAFWAESGAESGLACAGSVPCIACRFESGADRDGDAVEDAQDLCLDVPNPNQVDSDGDGYGNACDADFDGDGQVTGIDADRFFDCLIRDPQPVCDLDGDSFVDWLDFELLEMQLEAGVPGPSALVCDGNNALHPSFPFAPDDIYLNVIRDETSFGELLPEGADYPAPLTVAPTDPPLAGTLWITDRQTGGFGYRAHPGTAAGVDEASFTASDGHGLAREAALRLAIFEVPGRAYSSTDLANRALVVYNANAEGAEAIASHYQTRRGLGPDRLCEVRMPNGLYASRDQLLSLRRQIVEDCICPLVPPAERPSPCSVGPALETLRRVSPVSHLALVKGLPARIYGTGWPAISGLGDLGDESEPSLDFYLAYLLYRDQDLFCSDCPGPMQQSAVESPLGTDRSRQPREVEPAVDRFVAYGRVEAMTTERTLDLIDRTLAAEAAGITGNFLAEGMADFGTALRRTGTTRDECIDYTAHLPFQMGSAASTWPHESCRAGTTFSSTGVAKSGIMPGLGLTHIPVAVGTGIFIGGEPGPNRQTGFGSFEALRNWHRDAVDCTELCSELPGAEQASCRAESTDFFRELNTSCVGAAPGFLGMQLRSYPVTSYGFHPPGWEGPQSGHADSAPPSIRLGDAYGAPGFEDDRYLHLGAADWQDPDVSTCPGATGPEPCPEVIALLLRYRHQPTEPIPLAGDREFRVRLRHRNGANPGGSLQVTLDFHEGSSIWRAEESVALETATGGDWQTSEVTLWAPASRLAEITEVELVLDVEIEAAVFGFLDLDAIELIDVGSGSAANLLPLETASFESASQDRTHLGDYAANAIDRLGAIAWWGSSSHHATGGFAFALPNLAIEHLVSGVSLGSSIAASGQGESGIIYGDPLYRPSAAELTPVGVRDAKNGGLDSLHTHPGQLVTAQNLDASRVLLVSALHGTANLDRTRWSLSTCPVLDIKACDDASLWQGPLLEGQGAVRNQRVDWTSLIDSAVDQDVLIRLRVWNPGEAANALFDHAFYNYRAN